MERIKFLAIAACLAISSGVYAQFTNTSSSSSSTSVNTDGWNTIWVEYNPISVSFNQSVDDESLTGFSLGFSHAFPITSGTPLFVEAGLGVQYASFKNDFSYPNDGVYKDVKFTMISGKVPVNLIYDFAIPNSSIRIDPFVGLSFRFNLSAKVDFDDDNPDMNFFNKDDMGGSNGNCLKRFQAGWQIGFKTRFGDIFAVGAAYGKDFSNIWSGNMSGDKVRASVSTATLTLGYTF